ncbi:fluoride efflux transporter FluC [Candidatus Odyssella acanthamoebae]|uniref:Fluoride-specific ion channel FluC n=1 Tax=Candidatus Odyssella acanthamoebae TaxID=91604 RepID=A0A077AWT0_9PROT|nr:CrcB family protein [Candidatus Paracaedibacter acanthamoebae]AIK96946.1 hypothetical protein ID47_09735 [Candidatus Paracaedibacter acanthamoebae]
MLLHYLAVGIGGAAGAILRVFLIGFIPVIFIGLPLPIMVINFIGCFVMGILTELMAFVWKASEVVRYFWLSGFLGGFTTFSAFALDFGGLIEGGQLRAALIYAGTTVVLSLAGFMMGMKGTAAIVQVL